MTRTIIFIPSIGKGGWALLAAMFVGGVVLTVLVPELTLGSLMQGAAVGAGVMHELLRRLLLRIVKHEQMKEAETVEEAMNVPLPFSETPPPAMDEPSKIDELRANARWN